MVELQKRRRDDLVLYNVIRSQRNKLIHLTEVSILVIKFASWSLCWMRKIVENRIESWTFHDWLVMVIRSASVFVSWMNIYTIRNKVPPRQHHLTASVFTRNISTTIVLSRKILTTLWEVNRGTFASIKIHLDCHERFMCAYSNVTWCLRRTITLSHSNKLVLCLKLCLKGTCKMHGKWYKIQIHVPSPTSFELCVWKWLSIQGFCRCPKLCGWRHVHTLFAPKWSMAHLTTLKSPIETRNLWTTQDKWQHKAHVTYLTSIARALCAHVTSYIKIGSMGHWPCSSTMGDYLVLLSVTTTWSYWGLTAWSLLFFDGLVLNKVDHTCLSINVRI